MKENGNFALRSIDMDKGEERDAKSHRFSAYQRAQSREQSNMQQVTRVGQSVAITSLDPSAEALKQIASPLEESE